MSETILNDASLIGFSGLRFPFPSLSPLLPLQSCDFHRMISRVSSGAVSFIGDAFVTLDLQSPRICRIEPSNPGVSTAWRSRIITEQYIAQPRFPRANLTRGNELFRVQQVSEVPCAGCWERICPQVFWFCVGCKLYLCKYIVAVFYASTLN